MISFKIKKIFSGLIFSRPMSSFTWRDIVGPVCVFIDGRWKNGKVVEIRTNEVVYKLSGDPDTFIISKDEVNSIIRKRGTVASVGKGDQYTGSNPLIFGPKGYNIYGMQIVKRKDRPGGVYRVHFNYRTRKHHKVREIKLKLGNFVRVLLFILLFFCLFILLLLVHFAFCLFILLLLVYFAHRKTRPKPQRFVTTKFVNGYLILINLCHTNANADEDEDEDEDEVG